MELRPQTTVSTLASWPDDRIKPLTGASGAELDQIAGKIAA
eukprot:SAG11_NODE_16160_length_555_cov_1.407895_1_plen_40_part_01